MGWRELWIGCGFVLLVEGLPLFAAPHRYRALLRRLEDAPDEAPDAVLRSAGLAAATAGMLVLYAVTFGWFS